jgi:hypothetical protein
MSFTLRGFVAESNAIEGILTVKPADMAAHKDLLAAPAMTIALLEKFVSTVSPYIRLRDQLGMDVVVGDHEPLLGGPEIRVRLERMLALLDDDSLYHPKPFHTHCAYETLHPFMDVNGRSGRALWLWHMGGIEKVPLGFLHTWYYQSLD